MRERERDSICTKPWRIAVERDSVFDSYPSELVPRSVDFGNQGTWFCFSPLWLQGFQEAVASLAHDFINIRIH